jgi:hypothetical protein
MQKEQLKKEILDKLLEEELKKREQNGTTK